MFGYKKMKGGGGKRLVLGKEKVSLCGARSVNRGNGVGRKRRENSLGIA